MADINGSSVDEVLRYMLFTNEEELAIFEEEYAGAIRIGPSGRYGCRLWVKGNIVEFNLEQLPDNSENFFVTKNGSPFDPAEFGSLFRLVRHRAAEIMLAVRAGHAEYNKRKYEKRQPKKAKPIEGGD